MCARVESNILIKRESYYTDSCANIQYFYNTFFFVVPPALSSPRLFSKLYHSLFFSRSKFQQQTRRVRGEFPYTAIQRVHSRLNWYHGFFESVHCETHHLRHHFLLPLATAG